MTPTMAFRQLSKPTILKPDGAFERTSFISLMGIILGTFVTTVGIINNQTVLIGIGITEMLFVSFWLAYS
jgi:hypothetical protein|tara:strand:+ start:149 stop:358 length:210 start_codon:yes stop_codon:yes gene_type:complete